MAQRISVRPRPQGGDRPPIIKWGRDISAGTEFTAVYHGMHQGKFGPLATLETSKGPFAAPVKTVLLDQLARVRVGAKVAIKYLGMQTGNNGRSFHGFDVDVFEEADLLPEGTEPDIRKASGYNQPIRGSENGGFAPARKSAPASRPIRQVLPDPEPEAETEGVEEAEQEEAPAPAPKKPAAKPAARGRTLKSVFEGLD